MTLEFKKPPKVFEVAIRDEDGYVRRATATTDPEHPKMRNCKIVMPNGEVFKERRHMIDGEVLPSLANWLNSKEHDFIRTKGLNGKPYQTSGLSGTQSVGLAGGPVPIGPAIRYRED